MLGLGALITAAPVALVVSRVLGAGFLIVYGVLAARLAIRPGALGSQAPSESTDLRVAVTTVLALTWLDPHVSLDTVLFLGSVGSQQGTSERWWWVGGAATASILWFGGLGFRARLLRPLFARPVARRVLDAMIAIVMITLGLRPALGQ